MFTGTINVNGQLLDLSTPKVMGILNLTPDSFFKDSRMQTVEQISHKVTQMLTEGADILDVGAYSSRPGAVDLPIEEEMKRLREVLAVLRKEAPQAIVSVDTFRADVAKMCIEEFGVAMVNESCTLKCFLQFHVRAYHISSCTCKEHLKTCNKPLNTRMY